MDLSGPYRKTFDDTLDMSPRSPTRFIWSAWPNRKLDECRRRVQNETLGHRGRKGDPLYRARRLLTKAHDASTNEAKKSCWVCSELVTPVAR